MFQTAIIGTWPSRFILSNRTTYPLILQATSKCMKRHSMSGFPKSNLRLSAHSEGQFPAVVPYAALALIPSMTGYKWQEIALHNPPHIE